MASKFTPTVESLDERQNSLVSHILKPTIKSFTRAHKSSLLKPQDMETFQNTVTDSIAMMDTGTDAAPMDTVIPDIEILSKNLYASLDPSLNNDDRTIVYQYWTKLKEHYLESLQSGLALLDAGCSKADPLLSFGGLHLLENVVTNHWKRAGTEEKMHLRCKLLSLLQEGLPDDQSVRSALVRILVVFIKRQWPDKWPSMLEELQNIGQHGELQLMIVLNVLATLYQDVNQTDVQDEKIPNFRRKVLRPAIKDNVDKVWALLDSSLVSSSSPFLLAAAMETMSCYWLHMPLSSILQTGHPLIIIGHLATESLQNIAIKALIVLVNRKDDINSYYKERYQVLTLLMSPDLLDLISRVVNHTAQTLVQGDPYNFFKLCCELIGYIVTEQLTPLWQEDTQLPSSAGDFFQLMITILAHPCQFASSFMLPAWKTLLKHPLASHVISQYHQLLVSTLWTTIQKMEYVDYLGYQYRLIEFDLVEAFDDFFTGYRSTQLVIVQHLAIQSAPLIAHQLEQWLTEISATSFAGDTLSSSWDSFNHFLSILLANTSDAAEIASKYLVQLLLFNRQGSKFLSHYLKSLGILYPKAAVANSNCLIAVVEKCFEYAEFTGGEEIHQFSKEVLQTRHQAMSTLFSVVKSHGNQLVENFPKLYEHYQSLVESSSILLSEQPLLLNSLVTICNHVSDATQRLEFVRSLLEPKINHLDSLQQVLGSAEAFAKHLGLTDEEEVDGKHQGELLCSINSLCCVIKNGQQLDVNYYSLISKSFHIVTRIIRVLQLITSSTNSIVTSSCAKCSMMPEEEKGDIGSSDVINRLYQLCVLLVHHVFDVFSVYMLPDTELVWSTIKLLFAEQSVNLRTRYTIKHFLTPLMQQWPPDQYQEIQCEVFIFCVHHMSQLLNEVWRKLYSTHDYIVSNSEVPVTSHELKSGSQDTQTLSQEITELETVTLVTREFIHYLEMTCLVRSASDKWHEEMAESDNDSLSELAQRLLINKEYTWLLMTTVFSSLTWSDTHVTYPATKIAMAIINSIKEYNEDHVTLLDHAFKGLLIHSQSPHLPFILLVSLTMYKHLSHYQSTEVLLQQYCSSKPNDLMKLKNSITSDSPVKKQCDMLAKIILGKNSFHTPQRTN